ncbi:hypothetical protein BBF96_10480 [Anoxybacter fermentans]|uniref:Polymerase/histidinol phosphatase N-terminal domain-containing protein n=1 Tax=Anoxybacter fermentans TaxID=1323375 RepID=A0A3Q9HRA2_9FIRM|nr:PHP domain-containing protein [Anoxybacter fermentans]AZR73773.1 hypothetical protein BBF96_10480 [Anoxybacter fermentans]
MKKIKIDLHIHSNFSDGILTPTEIVTQAKQKKIQVIALTDHDTLDGIPELLKEAKKQNIPAICGIEFTCRMNGRVLHILAYNFDPENYEILQLVQNFNKLQAMLNLKRIRNFEKKFGHTIDLSKIPKKGNVTPIRLAYWLLETGQINPDEFPERIKDIYLLFEPSVRAFEKGYLSYLPLAENVVQIIRNAHGFPVLAHPQSQRVTFAELLRLYARGLKGIEAFYPDQDPLPYLNWAKKLSLAVTAGSDYHGILDRKERSIGFTIPKPLPDGLYLYTGDVTI